MKILGVIATVVVAAFVFVLLITGLVDAYIWIAGFLHAQYALGITTQASHSYDAVSGSLPVVVGVLGFSSVFTAGYKHINCEQPGCLRPGHRHPDHGRPVCRRHYHHDVVPEHP